MRNSAGNGPRTPPRGPCAIACATRFCSALICSGGNGLKRGPVMSLPRCEPQTQDRAIQQCPCGARKMLEISCPAQGNPSCAALAGPFSPWSHGRSALRAAAAGGGRADDFASRYIKVIVGPGLDAPARIFGAKAAEILGQQVVVEPRP